MVDCSKTKEFLQEWARLCRENICGERCGNITCPLEKACDGRYSWCYHFIKNCPVEAIEIIQKWSDENPIVTRQTEFLKLFPNARILHTHNTEVLDVCPSGLDNSFSCEDEDLCNDCKYKYWLQVVD